MSLMYSAREPMTLVKHGYVVHWRHRYGMWTACGQRNDGLSLPVTEDPPSCLECIVRVEC